VSQANKEDDNVIFFNNDSFFSGILLWRNSVRSLKLGWYTMSNFGRRMEYTIMITRAITALNINAERNAATLAMSASYNFTVSLQRPNPSTDKYIYIVSCQRCGSSFEKRRFHCRKYNCFVPFDIHGYANLLLLTFQPYYDAEATC
jgi:hypothetical protein